MEGKVKFGSLIVPSVQELVKKNLESVPPRYIHPFNQQDLVISQSDSLPEIPIIDMQRLLSQESTGSELAKLHHASKDWGFFQLINHGVSTSLLEKVKKETQDFFNLPMSEKKKYWQSSEDMEGFGQQFVGSEDQKLDWGDVFSLLTHPTHLRKPQLFPQLPLPFRDVLEEYSQQLKNLAVAIIEKMGKALKIEVMETKELFEDGLQTIRMNYYPSCPQPDKVIGFTPHSDGVGLTILLQVNEVEGLQIRKDGMWIPVKPLPNAFILNIGDILEIVTNGIYRSIEHRATVNSEKERLSIATFYSPGFDAEFGPATSLVTEETPAKFKRITVKDYLKGIFARKPDGRSYLDVMRKEQGS